MRAVYLDNNATMLPFFTAQFGLTREFCSVWRIALLPVTLNTACLTPPRSGPPTPEPAYQRKGVTPCQNGKL